MNVISEIRLNLRCQCFECVKSFETANSLEPCFSENFKLKFSFDVPFAELGNIEHIITPCKENFILMSTPCAVIIIIKISYLLKEASNFVINLD